MPKPLIVALLLGLTLVIGLLAWFGFGAVLGALEAVGWGAALVMLVRAGETGGAGLAWWCTLPDRPLGLARICMLLRWIREAVNCLLPVAHVGGDLAGARLLTFWGVSGARAGATVVADIFLQTVTQALFTLIGLACLIQVDGDTAMVRTVAIGLAILAPALVAFFVAQRYGGLALVDKVAKLLAQDAKWTALGGAAALDAELKAVYARPSGPILGFVLHMALWFLGVMEVWIALHWMGYPVDYRTALVIESLGQAVRGAAFVVPGAIGVQEGGFIALCAVFGIPAPTAIALSLVKRVPEIVLGIPGLLIWQGLEGRKLLQGGTATGKTRG